MSNPDATRPQETAAPTTEEAEAPGWGQGYPGLQALPGVVYLYHSGERMDDELFDLLDSFEDASKNPTDG